MMQFRRRYSFVAVPAAVVSGLALFIVLPVCAAAVEEWKAPARASRRKNPVPASEASVATGKQYYIKECLSCHGPTGKGDGPAASALTKSPGNLSSPKMWEQTDGALFWKITEGNKPMPSEENVFTPAQRWDLINYVRTLAPRPAPAAPAQSNPG